jgi:hypothetical protein
MLLLCVSLESCNNCIFILINFFGSVRSFGWLVGCFRSNAGAQRAAGSAAEGVGRHCE